MKAIILFFILCLKSFISCVFPAMEDTFNSRELISSKGEKIYINSINWGVTDDWQATTISSKKNKLKDRTNIDSDEMIKGLGPFIYSFNSDTLKLFFEDSVTYTVKEQFKTISIKYYKLKESDYRVIAQMSRNNEGYYSVPMNENTIYPSDMPLPPAGAGQVH